MKIGAKDDFEQQYMARFRHLAAPHGIFVEYQTDRAGRDLGLHFTQPTQTGGKIVSPSLIWFQMKGIMPSTLNRNDYEAAKEVKVVLDVSHLRFWYMNVQPTYLAVYVGCADEFLVIDIKEWVAKNYGNSILTLPQDTLTIKVRKENHLDDDFFRLALQKNLIPSLRGMLAQENDKLIARFLRDSSIVKWLSASQKSGSACRIIVIKYMSKMRTEVYFESQNDGGGWDQIREHWQFAMGDLNIEFPYLALSPQRKAVIHERIESIDYGEYEDEHHVRYIHIDESDEDDFWDEEEMDYECLLEIGNGEYSYGEMHGGEAIMHNIKIDLNEVGERWASTLNALEESEIISVSVGFEAVSVAPWHARDI